MTSRYTTHATFHADGRWEWHVCPTHNRPAHMCDHLDQENPMTSPTQRRHDELVALLTEIRDALSPDYVIETRTCRKSEPVNTESARDHLHRLLAEESAAERRDEPVDTAPDVDPDEALAKVLWQYLPDEDDEWAETYADESNVTKHQMQVLARAAREHIETEVREDVERLTRERDDLRARVDDLIRERGQVIERYRALRADIARTAGWPDFGAHSGVLLGLLRRDDDRGRDA